MEKSLNNQQAPANVHVNINSVFTPAYQWRVNKILKSPIFECKKTIMTEIMYIVRQELEEIVIDTGDFKEEHIVHKHNY